MKASRESLEQKLESYGEKLKGFNSFVKELTATTDKYGTDKAQFEEDLMEAVQNIKYYEGEMAQIKLELGKLPKAERPQPKPSKLPLPPATIGSFTLSAVSFIVGALLGSTLKSGKSSKDGAE